MTTERVALAHYRNRRALAIAAATAAQRLWAQVDRSRIVASWRLLIPQMLVVLTGAQQAAARDADGYTDAVLDAQGVDAAALGRVDATALAGIASDGRPLDSLLTSPAFGVLSAIGKGADQPRALAGGLASLDMIVRTQVADAGRAADQVAMAARPAVTGYVRMVVGLTCSRCAVLAGKRFRWNAGFQRHFRCDCIHVPADGDSADDLRTDPRAYFDSLSTAEQDETFTKGGAEAIRAGASIDKVVNASRGLYTAGGKEYTTEAAGRRPRITPDQIMADAKGDRDEAVRLLRLHGYLSGQPAVGRSGRAVRLPEQRQPEPGPAILPDAVREKVAAARRSVPRSREEWDALVPRQPSFNDRQRERVSDARRKADQVRQRLKEFTDRVDQSMKESGVRPAARRKFIERTEEYQRFRSVLEMHEGDIARLNKEIDKARPEDESATVAFPLDGGRFMPTEDYHRRLDAMMDVGRVVLAEARRRWDSDPELKPLRERVAVRERLRDLVRTTPVADRSREQRRQIRELRDQIDEFGSAFSEDERAVRRREAQILRELVASARPVGGVRHGSVTPQTGNDTPDDRGAHGDWEARLRTAEGYFPDDWLTRSAARPLSVTSSDRAYYDGNDKGGLLAMPANKYTYDGAFDDSIDEVTVHELGHRMETLVPGLTEMEWTLVRRRATDADGKLEVAARLRDVTGGGYRDSEVTFRDRWANAYAGKTYEPRTPAAKPWATAWELFQVGLQDTFGRGPRRFDDTDDLQEFTIGALLTLGHPV